MKFKKRHSKTHNRHKQIWLNSRKHSENTSIWSNDAWLQFSRGNCKRLVPYKTVRDWLTKDRDRYWTHFAIIQSRNLSHREIKLKQNPNRNKNNTLKLEYWKIMKWNNIWLDLWSGRCLHINCADSAQLNDSRLCVNHVFTIRNWLLGVCHANLKWVAATFLFLRLFETICKLPARFARSDIEHFVYMFMYKKNSLALFTVLKWERERGTRKTIMQSQLCSFSEISKERENKYITHERIERRCYFVNVD